MFCEHHSLCHGQWLNIKLNNPNSQLRSLLLLKKNMLLIISNDYLVGVKLPET